MAKINYRKPFAFDDKYGGVSRPLITPKTNEPAKSSKSLLGILGIGDPYKNFGGTKPNNPFINPNFDPYSGIGGGGVSSWGGGQANPPAGQPQQNIPTMTSGQNDLSMIEERARLDGIAQQKRKELAKTVDSSAAEFDSNKKVLTDFYSEKSGVKVPTLMSTLPKSEQDRLDEQKRRRVEELTIESKREMERIEKKGQTNLGGGRSFLSKIGALGRTITGAPEESGLGELSNIRNKIDSALQEERENLQTRIGAVGTEFEGKTEERVGALNKLLTDNFDLAIKQETADRESEGEYTQSLMNLFSGGYDPESLKEYSQEQYDKLISSSGLSDLEAQSVWNTLQSTDPADLIKVSAGESLYDPNTGSVRYTAPDKPSDNKPTTQKTDDGSILQWDPETESWNEIYRGGLSAYQQGQLDVDWAKFGLDAEKFANEDKETQQSAEKILVQLDLVDKGLKNSYDFAGASGRSGARKSFDEFFIGSTDYTNLIAETNTVKTNILSLTTDPNIKKFFGPQMSDADVRLMTSAGTTLNPELQSPVKLVEELDRIKDLMARMRKSVVDGLNKNAQSAGGNDPFANTDLDVGFEDF